MTESRYIIYIDVFSDPPEPMRLYIDGRSQREGNVLNRELSKSLLDLNWSNFWNRVPMLNNVHGVRKVVRVEGSEFGKRLFKAIAGYLATDIGKEEEYGFVCDADENVELPLKTINIPLDERERRFETLCKKHNFNQIASLTVNIEGPGSNELAQKLCEYFKDRHLFSINFVVGAINADLDIILDSTDDLEARNAKSSKSAKMLFAVDPELPDGILNPRGARDAGLMITNDCLIWYFKDEENLLPVLKTYIEYYLIREFVRLCREFGKAKIGELDPDEIKEWLTISRSSPCSYAVLPECATVECETNITIGGIGPCGPKDLPTINIGEETFCGGGRHTYTPTQVRTEKVSVVPAEYDHIFIQPRNGVMNVAKGIETIIRVDNHCLTTDMSILVLGDLAPDINLVPENGELVFEVCAENRYERYNDGITLKDADDWQWVLSPADGAQVERIGKELLFHPKQPGEWKLRVFWPDAAKDDDHDMALPVPWTPKRNLCREITIQALQLASSLRVEVDPIPAKGHPPLEIDYGKDITTIKCFPYDAVIISAQLEGKAPGKIWDNGIKIDSPNYGSQPVVPNKRKKTTFTQVGDKEFTISNLDGRLAKRFAVIVKPNHSEKTKNLMVSLSILSIITAYATYGINWLNILIYLAPVGVAVFHFTHRLPMYRKLIQCLSVVAVFIILRALWHEVS